MKQIYKLRNIFFNNFNRQNSKSKHNFLTDSPHFQRHIHIITKPKLFWAVRLVTQTLVAPRTAILSGLGGRVATAIGHESVSIAIPSGTIEPIIRVQAGTFLVDGLTITASRGGLSVFAVPPVWNPIGSLQLDGSLVVPVPGFKPIVTHEHAYLITVLMSPLFDFI